jgi:hypothetical protein
LKTLYYAAFVLLICGGCARQPSLPANSLFNVTSMLNDSSWYGTGQILRIKEPTQKLEDVRQFNLSVFTDIDYPGINNNEPNPNTDNGCVDPECTRTQALTIYNIPLRKGRTMIGRLSKRNTPQNEQISLYYLGNSGGTYKRYIDKGLKPSWIKVTKVDKTLGIVEGQFTISLKEDLTVFNRLQNGMPETARFTRGLFRIKIKDVIIKDK